MKFQLVLVKFMPKELEEGVLYYSKEYNTAAHLCACGCRSKIRTPILETEWKISFGKDGPTLHPSIGNWQLPCRSHYVINNGKVIWAGDFTDEEVISGRKHEEQVREEYFERKYIKSEGALSKIWNWIKSIFGKL